MIDVKCIRGTRERNIIKGEIYRAEESESWLLNGNRWLLVKCKDGIKRYFKKDRFIIIEWEEVKK